MTGSVFVYFNSGCERLTGYTSDEVLASEKPCWQITECRDEHGRVLANKLCAARGVLEGDQLSARQLVRLTTKGGEQRMGRDAVYASQGQIG